MPAYEFNVVGSERIIEKHFLMSKAPELGQVILLDEGGKKVKAERIVSSTARQQPVWQPYVSSVLPRNMKGFNCTPEGKPIIDSQATERRACSFTGWRRD
jgi:hypothetical protein